MFGHSSLPSPASRLLPLLLGAVLLGTVAGSALAEGATGRGDFGIFLESFSQPAAADATRLLLAVQLPVQELAWREKGDSLVAEIRCRWSLHSLGQEATAVDERLPLSRPPGQPLATMLYLREVEVPAGEYRLELECEDLGRSVGGVLGLFDRHPRATIDATLTARDFSAGGELGDPLLYRVLADGESTRFNPSNAFFLGEPAIELQAVFAAPDSAGHFGLALALRDAAGLTRLNKRGAWNYAPGENLPLRFRLPLGGLEAGSYTLSLELHGPGIGTSTRETTLEIVGTGEIADEELARRGVEAQLFLDGDTYQGWSRLSALQRVLAMEAFWKRQDPTPDSADNPVYDEFLRRFALAQSRYSVLKAGALSDRGRMLIRYGEPSSIDAEAMPLNREGLTNAVRGLHGQEAVDPMLSPYDPEFVSGEGDPGRNRELASDLKGIGTGGLIDFGDDSEAYEIWTYALGGEPLLPEYKLHLRGVSLQVIFVDENGYGDYTLRYRSEDFDF